MQRIYIKWMLLLLFALSGSNLYSQIELAQQVIESTMKRSPSDLNNWAYPAGFYLFGQYRIWKRYVDSHVDANGHIDVTINSLDNSQPGLVTLLCYIETGEQKYKLAADYIRNIYRTYPRTSDGAFWHTDNNGGQIWLDGVYMILPFLANYAHVMNDTSLYTEVANQIITYASHLSDSSGLLYHAYDEDGSASWADPVTHHSLYFWGRSMGWFGMAIVEILEVMPEDHPKRAALIRILKNLISGLSNVQDKATGLWFQIVDEGDRADNWLESSCSCMYSYFTARAVYKGYIDNSYLDMAVKAYQGILQYKFYLGTDGLANLKDISQGTSVSDDYYYYINRSRNTNDLHGLGAFLMMCWQMDQTGANTNINIPPVVNIISPADSASFWTASNFTISATAYDLDGVVDQVAFYEGDTLLFTDYKAPYEFTWENVPNGNYTITAVATDDSNATTISTPIHISVSNDLFFIEAETGVISDGSVDNNHQGYTGSGFVNLVNSRGTYLELSIDIPESGTWDVSFRYANGTTDNRPCAISVDGSIVSEQFDFPPTVDWTNWQYSDTLTLDFVKGTRTLRITGLTSVSAPNLDNLKFVFMNSPTAVRSTSDNLPEGFQLHQNYPNPFNAETQIAFSLSHKTSVSVQIVNLVGQVVKQIPEKKYDAGSYYLRFDASHLASGVYFYVFKTPEGSRMNKMLLLK
jgi:unsaturated rhamnogalacturonyl hydrolase